MNDYFSNAITAHSRREHLAQEMQRERLADTVKSPNNVKKQLQRTARRTLRMTGSVLITLGAWIQVKPEPTYTEQVSLMSR